MHANQRPVSFFLSLCYSVGQWCLTGEERERGLRPDKVRVPAALLDASALAILSRAEESSCREGDDGRRCAGSGGVGTGRVCR